MANDLNSVTLVGRITRTPELKYTPSGTAWLNISIAVNRRKKTGDTWDDEVSFFDATIWGKLAEALSSYLEKGKQIAVQGGLLQQRWEKDGVKRSKVSINVRSLQMLSDPRGIATSQQTGPSGNTNQGNKSTTQRASSAPRSHDEFTNFRGDQNKGGSSPVADDGPESFFDDIPF